VEEGAVAVGGVVKGLRALIVVSNIYKRRGEARSVEESKTVPRPYGKIFMPCVVRKIVQIPL